MKYEPLANTKQYLEWLAQQHGDQYCDKCDLVSYSDLATMSPEQRDAYAPLSTRNALVRRCLVCAHHFPYAWARDLDPWKVLEFCRSKAGAFDVTLMRDACS